MSYLYKGMAGLGSKSGAGGEVSGSVLLTWHEKVGLAFCRSAGRRSCRDRREEDADAVVDGSRGCWVYRAGHDRPEDAMRVLVRDARVWG